LKLIRQKRNLKRLRAKNRQFIPKKLVLNEEISTQNEEIEDEAKKKRNRISAQISRDRKKQKVKEL
jgi:hypothetical protein